MRTLKTLVVAMLLGVAVPAAGQTGCAGFTDVNSASTFCPNVEWIKNRAVTLGCGPNLYCPDDFVVRLSMAAFLNRLGTALTPVVLNAEGAPGAVDLDATPAPVVCQTADFVVASFPRRADVSGTVSGSAGSPVDVGATLVRSFDGGATWAALAAADSRATMGGAGSWGGMAQFATVNLDVTQTVRFGIQLARVGAGATDILDSRCQVKTSINSRDGTTSPL